MKGKESYSLNAEIQKAVELFQGLKLIISDPKKTQINFRNPSSEENKNVQKIVKVLHENVIKAYNILKTSYLDKINEEFSDLIKNIQKQLKLEEFDESFPNLNKPKDDNSRKLFLEYKKLKKHFNVLKDKVIQLFKYFYQKFSDIINFINTFPDNIDKIIVFGENLNQNDVNYISKIYNSYIQNVELFNTISYYISELGSKTKNLANDDNLSSNNLLFDNLEKELQEYKERVQNPEYQINISLKEFKKVYEFSKKHLLNLKDCFDKNLPAKSIDKIIKDFLDTKNMRLDILIVLDTTNSMLEQKTKLVKDFENIVNEIKTQCYLSLFYIGFIGYKDFSDLDLGEEYVDIDLTRDTSKVFEAIKNVEVDGGDDIPEDLAGAFELALKKSWGEDTKIIFLITDSPCHGKDYHNLDQGVEEYKDKYIKEPRGKKMKVLIKELAEKNIYLICLDYGIFTKIMFDRFKQIYAEEKKQNYFSVEKGDIKNIIVNKTIEIFKEKQNEILKNLENPQKRNKQNQES